jgi:signal transduction histidine kinase/pSer/pThr/pTyr-binding forkhead associated (FHA) protein
MKIAIVSEGENGRVFDFEDTAEVVVGRDEQCSITLVDPKVSRRHARFFSRNNRILVEDMGSSNGIRVNGMKVQEMALEEGDKVVLGDTILAVSGLPSVHFDRPSNRMVRVAKRTQTVVLSVMPHDKANVMEHGATSDELEALREDRRSLRALHDISRVLASPLGLEESLYTVVGTLREFGEADTACVLTRNKEGQGWDVRAFRTLSAPDAQMQISETIIRQSLDEGVAILCRDPITDERFQGSVSMIVEGVTSALCSPIRFDGGFNGVLFLDRRNRPDVFTEKELRLATTVANLVGLLLDKDRMDHGARQRERLAVISEVVATLAHHAKDLMEGMNSGLSALKAVAAQRQFEKLPEQVRVFETRNDRLSDVVSNMLSYAKEWTPVYTRVNLGRVLEASASTVRGRLAELGVSLTVDCRPPEIEVWAEEAALQRVFLNLLMNSLEALQGETKGSKEIRVTVEPRDKSWVEIRFRDTGTGIAPDDLGKVFDVFFSKNVANGTGLGLAVVKKIITEHGGEVKVASEPGAWTEFSILLTAPQGE